MTKIPCNRGALPGTGEDIPGQSPPKDKKARLAILCLTLLTSGCTSLQSHTTLDPYTRNRAYRDAVEGLADSYCRAKRWIPGDSIPPKLPDYLFTTDGCSRFPDDGWAGCCVVHDIAYWCGGSEDDREAADRWFRGCLDGKTHLLSGLMYWGVRLGGAAFWPAPWRWGYGWEDWPRGYEELKGSPSVEKLMEKLDAYKTVESHLPR